jgi:putative hydrolase
MIEVDLHAHSFFSRCGMHTVIEMLDAARRCGMKALAITDHGLSLGGHINSSFFERLRAPVDGITLLKGVECNIMDEHGRIDCPKEFLPYMDVVLLGLHQNLSKKLDSQMYTDMVIAALDMNPYVTMVTHPNDVNYPVYMDRLAAACKARGVALELNNAKVLYRRIPAERTRELIAVCKETACPVVVNSDAHTVNEVGRDADILPLIHEAALPQELIENRDAEAGDAFVQRSRKRIGDYVATMDPALLRR